jgi:hypothetical protein
MKIWNELTSEKPSDLLATVSLSSHASPVAVLIARPAPPMKPALASPIGLPCSVLSARPC